MFLSLHTMLHSYVHVTGNARMGWGGVGWGCERSFEVEHAIDATLSMGWGGVGWGCERSFEVEHAIDATLSMGWGGDVNVSFEVEHAIDATLSMGWGGVGMWTFVWSWTRHWCDAEHGVGWSGVGMWTFVWSWTRHWCYAEHGVGWGCERSFEVEHAIDATLIMGWHGVGWGCERSFEVEHAIDATLSMGWGGDVNVRLKLNTPLMLRWAWGWVGMWTFRLKLNKPWCYAEHGEILINTFDPGNGDGKTRCVLTCWKKQHRSTCTMITETGKAEKGPDFVWKGCQTQEKWLFSFQRFLLWDGYETLKGLSFFDNGDAPTRAIPHPAGCLSTSILMDWRSL